MSAFMHYVLDELTKISKVRTIGADVQGTPYLVPPSALNKGGLPSTKPGDREEAKRVNTKLAPDPEWIPTNEDGEVSDKTIQQLEKRGASALFLKLAKCSKHKKKKKKKGGKK